MLKIVEKAPAKKATMHELAQAILKRNVSRVELLSKSVPDINRLVVVEFKEGVKMKCDVATLAQECARGASSYSNKLAFYRILDILHEAGAVSGGRKAGAGRPADQNFEKLLEA